MNLNENRIITRFNMFFNITGMTRSEFSDQIGIKNQNFIRFFKSESLILKQSPKLMEMGCNMNWLISGEGPIIYTNEAGVKLIENNNILTEDGYLKISRAKHRIVLWINEHFGSLDFFCREHKLNSDKLLNDLSNNENDNFYTLLPNYILVTLHQSGCNLSWVLSESDEIYSPNENGLRLKRESKNPNKKFKIHELQNGKDVI